MQRKSVKVTRMHVDMEDIKILADKILARCSNPEQGLPEEIFLMISGLIPIPNVDLFLLNKEGQILLSWRKDQFYQEGWSLPGGCMRFGETMHERVLKTAQKELGQAVHIEKGPLCVRDAIRGDNPKLKYPHVRGHNIAVPFLCSLTEALDIKTQSCAERENGCLKWFSEIPQNVLPIHHIYDDLFREYGLLS